MKEQKEMTKLAYTAGTIDGDGSISLCKRKDSRGTPSPLYYPFVQLGKQNEVLPKFLYENFGGRLGFRRLKSGKTFHTWSLEKQAKCFPFLEEISDFLVIKKERAKFLLEYIKNNPFLRGGKKLDANTLSIREKAYSDMLRFNDKKILHENITKKERIFNTEDSIFWAYLAGILDTDGSFSLCKQIKPVLSYSPRIMITMSDSRGINYILKNCTHGQARFLKIISFDGNHYPRYRFAVSAVSEVSDFLERIIPYLLVKKEQAKILLTFCKERKSYIGGSVPLEEIAFREQCYSRIIELNDGVYKSSLIDSKPLPSGVEGNEAEDESHRERSKREDSERGCSTLNSMET